MNTRGTTAAAATAAPSEIPNRMMNLEIQMWEIKDLLVTLTVAQTRILTMLPVDTTVLSVEGTEQQVSPIQNSYSYLQQSINIREQGHSLFLLIL
ncbi:hypothetical protein V495_06169 [Pseudogymnoascus sp. VKM F-4514 (FW-929)]|nr:hypothetical protein V495_06169 [Pseudogymnoascus sp. VKM F-4514 (FW-929)]